MMIYCIDGPIIDGDNLENNIIYDMRRLNKFTNNQIISSVDYFSRRELYSYPYIWTFYHNIENNFPRGLFKSVREISLYYDRPFEHEFFLRITQSFPFFTKLTIHNYHLEQSIIKYSHLVEIDLVKTHQDYLDEFLNKSLKKVTNHFTRDETRINCSEIIRLTVFVTPTSTENSEQTVFNCISTSSQDIATISSTRQNNNKQIS
ncbi:unnamed protein product [Rotaria magnacalcarata]|uniref:Uncharacterized protein n=1 Tax=Rotaria magnacalcarata TaxID=392030 RepID=A0A819Z662_9BILA|nr:unnamed protein product [Rotaria magnacalcarata]